MFDPEKFIEEKVKEIREIIKNEKAVIALSGGVDSSTCAALTYRAIGENLTPIFVDTGFMRLGEPEKIKETFSNMNLTFIDAKERFFNRLRGIEDPEEKRKIIGEEFIRIFEEEAKKIGASFLVQGTIAPDWIESRGGIKSHHNVGGLPEKFGLKLVEPLADLYKDEVRILAKYLNLPDEIAERMPFPGPGLAVRIVGEVTPDKVEIVRKADAIVKEEIKSLDIRPWQAFAVLLSGKATGVKGDIRAYGYMVAVRIVLSSDGMTANILEAPWSLLKKIQQRVTSEIPEVSRVLYDITDKPPATIEFE
ncbi:MAG: glutamine-hydrolyzing GMP synthase [Candidatus Hydrothermarchaeota archaeon]